MSSTGTHNIQTMHSKGVVVEVMQKSNMYDNKLFYFLFLFLSYQFQFLHFTSFRITLKQEKKYF